MNEKEKNNRVELFDTYEKLKTTLTKY